MRRIPPTNTIAILGGIFLLLDQGLKYLANTYPSFSLYIWKPWFGWEFFPNPGIAFSLPFPQFILIIGTPIVLFWLYYIIIKEEKKNRLAMPGLIFIVYGALSNFIDRLMFGYTIDYLRIFTGIINLADIMIIIGVVALLLGEKHRK